MDLATFISCIPMSGRRFRITGTDPTDVETIRRHLGTVIPAAFFPNDEDGPPHSTDIVLQCDPVSTDRITELCATASLVVAVVDGHIAEKAREAFQAARLHLAKCKPSRDDKLIVQVCASEPLQRLVVQGKCMLPQGGMMEVRMSGPMQFMASEPGVRSFLNTGAFESVELEPEEKSIYLWQRPILNRPIDLKEIMDLRRAGHTIVVEFDDDPDVAPGIAEAEYLTFAGVHGVLTSTERLAERLRPFNPNVFVMENSVASRPALSALIAAKPEDRVRFFFGAFNRAESWQSWMPALNRIARRQDVEFSVLADRAFFEALETDRKVFYPACGYPEYRKLVAASHIALMPLANTGFNRMKSDLKLVEAASLGAAVIASSTLYEETASVACDAGFGKIASIVHDENPESAIIELLDPNVRLQQITAAWNYVGSRRMLSNQSPEVLGWFRHLVANREELDHALEQRLLPIVQEHFLNRKPGTQGA